MLWALFFRPVGFDFRSKLDAAAWRNGWDWGLFLGSAVPPVIFGVAFGNLLQGVPFHFDDNLVPHYTGSFWQLLNPFALLAGVVGLSMIVFHGANYLMHRTEGAIHARAQRASLVFGALLVASFAAAGVWVAAGIGGYAITAGADPAAVSNPLAKTVEVTPGAWLANYARYPLTLAVPAAGFAGALAGVFFAWRGWTLAAFVASSVAMAGVIGTAAVSMFPFVMPSSSDPRSSLTMWDSTSSHLTLALMFWAVVIFMPLVIFYTRWAYGVIAGKVTAAYIRENRRSAY